MNESTNPFDDADELVDQLSALTPALPNVSTGRVMFQAGKVEGVRVGVQEQKARQQSGARLWQLATACSLLLAAGLFIRSTGNETPSIDSSGTVALKSETKTDSKPDVTSELNERPSSTRGRGESKQLRTRFKRTRAVEFLAMFGGFSAEIQNRKTRSEMILHQGLASSPRPLVGQVNSFDLFPIDRKSQLELLLPQTGNFQEGLE